MENRKKEVKKLVTFLVLVFVLSGSATYAMYITRQPNLVYLVMWCPAISAFITNGVYRQSPGGMGWSWGQTRWQITSYFLPIGYCLVAYGFVWLTGLGILNTAHELHLSIAAGLRIPVNLATFALLGTLVSAGSAAGEEIGWRGFLIPRLYSITGRNFTVTALVGGIIWAVWHYPLVILAGYNQGGPLSYSLLILSLQVISAGVIITWLRLKSGSLWTGVILHASHNLWLQQFFNPITTSTGQTNLYIGEFGLVPTVVLVATAAVFLGLRKHLVMERHLPGTPPA